MLDSSYVWRNLALLPVDELAPFLPPKWEVRHVGRCNVFLYAGIEVLSLYQIDILQKWLPGLSDEAKAMLSDALFRAEEEWQEARRQRPIKVMQALGLIDGT